MSHHSTYNGKNYSISSTNSGGCFSEEKKLPIQHLDRSSTKGGPKVLIISISITEGWCCLQKLCTDFHIYEECKFYISRGLERRVFVCKHLFLIAGFAIISRGRMRFMDIDQMKMVKEGKKGVRPSGQPLREMVVVKRSCSPWRKRWVKLNVE